MRPSFLAVSAAFLSLSTAVQAVPQGAFSPSSSSIAPVAAISQAPAPSSTRACNNSPQLCNRNYNNITHMGTHNAAFLRDRSTSFSMSGNQGFNVTVSLDAGIRLLQAQFHNVNGTARLCHSSCSLLDAGPLETWLAQIKSWMDRNPNDVVTLVLVNADDMSAAALGPIFVSSGISRYGYIPASRRATATWPTLQTLISAGTRLVTFVADVKYDATYPYLLPEFDYVFETAFGVTSMDGFNCTLHRPNSQPSASAAIANGYLGMVNHFLDVAQTFFQSPDIDNLPTTNSPRPGVRGGLATHGERCQSEWGIKPAFILVNFFNAGPAIATADRLNGITATGRLNVSLALPSAESAAFKQDAASWSMLAAIGMGAVAAANFLWL